MATFKYEAVMKTTAEEDHFESGYVVAPTKEAAERKLRDQQLEARRLERVGGIRGLFKALVADIK